jgi:hypothetical protein
MEAFGIAIALVGGLLAAPIFCFVLAKVVRRFPRVAALLVLVSIPLVLLYALELIIVLTRGILSARALIGSPYFLIHVVLTLSSAPALAAVICWFVGAGSIFYQYDVAETLYGIDGQGGPYQWPW